MATQVSDVPEGARQGHLARRRARARRGRVAILGGGIVGSHAARIAVGLGAQVTLLEVNHDRMAYLEDIFQGQIETLYSNPKNVAESVAAADLVVGGVLVTGAKAPKLVTEDLIKQMKPGSVVVDVAVDQGGCIGVPSQRGIPPTCCTTSCCCVPVCRARSADSAFALTNVTSLRGIMAREGVEARCPHAPLAGVNCWDGYCAIQGVARRRRRVHAARQARQLSRSVCVTASPSSSAKSSPLADRQSVTPRPTFACHWRGMSAGRSPSASPGGITSNANEPSSVNHS
jgi:alanine dehydrogenase